MNTFITYIIATVVSLGIFYGTYILLLRKEALFRFNRVYLLSGLLLSYLIPLITLLPESFFRSFLKSDNGGIFRTITLAPVEISATAVNDPSIVSFAVYAYAAGVVFFALRLIARGFSIYQLHKKCEKTLENNSSILWINKDIPPFSFFGFMYLPVTLKDTQHVNEIISHEQIHINSLHSFDILITQLMQILFWFNPFIPLIENMLRENHEFEADKAVIHAGTDPVAYTRILFGQDKAAQAIILGNNFNYSLIKRRLTMFYKQSTRFARIKSFLVLPMAVSIVMIYAISCKQVNDPVAPPPPPPPPPPPTELPVTADEVFTVVENMPQYTGGDEARMKFLMANIKYPESAKQEGLQGTVYVSFVVEQDGQIANVKILKGIGKACDDEAFRVVSAMPKWIPGKQKGQAVRVQFNMPIKFTLAD